jgi:ubiquinone/menaquinone biosynthesis C-methylase UbiE
MASNVYDSAEGYDLWAKHYDEKEVFLNSFEEGSMGNFWGDLQGKKVLDLGCGTGRLISEMLIDGGEVTGVDVSDEMLKIAREKFPNVEFVQGISSDLPFENDTFDVVVAAFLIVHVRDLRTTFREIHRVLKEGGRLILTNINQRKSPKLKMDGKEIVIKSHYHMPDHVIKALEDEIFTIEDEKFLYDGEMWVNQIIKALT